MLEAEVDTVQGPKKVLWYAHKDITQNQVLLLGDVQVNVVAWTHAGFQMGLSGKLNQRREFRRAAFAITAISPLARARFSHVLPSIAGLYDPGGEVAAPADAIPVRSGLKAVKLEMTPEQVEAFIARMNGMLMVTGAPGTGKTTIAFQRIRFLFDQQDLEDPEDRSSAVIYAPALTRVFLASPHLIKYSRRLLKDELQVPAEVVSLVPDFIKEYVETTWQARGNARPITRDIREDTKRAREAMLNLCRAEDLSGMWAQLEKQARSRLRDADAWDWLKIADDKGGTASSAARVLGAAMGQVPSGTTGEPVGSPIRLDAIWTQVGQSYNFCRAQLSERQRERFDRAFASWLFWVFDPIDVLAAHVVATRSRAIARILQGTADRTDATKVLSEVLSDWDKRLYGEQELSWIAWILRFVLPEEASPDDSFRGVPRAIPQPDHKTVRRWTHVVIDEAQDLAVQEASLLASFVDRRGALTVSADFHQVVSPVHGMTDAAALMFGLPIWDRSLHLQFSFQRNLRQCREIAQFLRGFYEKAFGEFPPFDAGDREEGLKPQLYVGPSANFPKLVAQMTNVFQRKGSLQHVAVISVNDNPAALEQTRRSLKAQGLSVAAEGVLFEPDQLVVTSVERAKGLEFDACIIIGLDDVDHASMNFAKNRAYVALSRPTRRLFMMCETYPSLLEGVAPALFDRHTL